ncbi:hypothetical protein Pla163_10640 [Planctomycetes bacterium Pla163]|uniref:Uncharacterized protein n=1 Tax=Rohdeia mirabilis TaxID=2528008 RepID=A0A518CXK9_9BACT|nr:hypothetical protein Pla163_10640 [Planctomycetes bacterium Pla163]
MSCGPRPQAYPFDDLPHTPIPRGRVVIAVVPVVLLVLIAWL